MHECKKSLEHPFNGFSTSIMIMNHDLFTSLYLQVPSTLEHRIFSTRSKNVFRSMAPLYPHGLDENCAVSKLTLHPGYVVNAFTAGNNFCARH